MPASPPIDSQDWKCRECGFVNISRNIICDVCESPKPARPLLESSLNYTKRNPSTSPVRRRSPSPIEENTYNRAGSNQRRKSMKKVEFGFDPVGQ